MTQKEIWEKVYAKAWELNGGTNGFIEGMARYGLKMAGMETPTITTPAVPEQMVLEEVKKETTPDRYTRAGVHIVLRNKSGMKIDFKNAAVASEWMGRSSGYIMDRIRCGDAIYSRTEDGRRGEQFWVDNIDEVMTKIRRRQDNSKETTLVDCSNGQVLTFRKQEDACFFLGRGPSYIYNCDQGGRPITNTQGTEFLWIKEA